MDYSATFRSNQVFFPAWLISPCFQDETFLEDINTILNTGDIPNLYENEERLEIIEKVLMRESYSCFFIDLNSWE